MRVQATTMPTLRPAPRREPVFALPDCFCPSREVAPPIYGPGLADPVRSAVGRLLVTETTPERMAVLVDGLRPYGSAILNRLADNGLTLEIPEQGFAHYSTDAKRVYLPQKDLDADTEVPFREYMIVHEMAHALDFLWEPEKGPLSERSDLGIAAHRTRLNRLYQPVLNRFERIKAQKQAEGTWGPRPDWPVVRVYMEDLTTVVEAVTGEQLAERPARGHVTILDPDTRPTEYFADSVYCFLHSEPSRSYRYRLPTGGDFEHRYPPDRDMLQQRDPKMHQALLRFFESGHSQALSF